MKFVCERNSLIKSINTVSKAVSQRTTIPTLKGILLKVTDEGQLYLMASDLDISIEKCMDVKAHNAGSVIVDSKLFSEIIRKIPEGETEISTDEKYVVSINSGSSHFNVIGQDPERFPGIGDVENIESRIEFDKKALSDMIRKTYFCASPEEAKGIITGVLFEMKEDSFNMVALDGYRMAVVRDKKENEEKINMVVPGRILSEAAKIMSEDENEDDEKAIFVISDKKCVMLLEKTKVVMRLLEGKFMEYEKIIPAGNSIKVTADRREILDSLERASLFSKAGKNNLVKINIKENTININSSSEEGNVSEDIEARKEGGDIEIGFNSKYLIDALKNIDEDQIVMEFENPVKPCLIKPVEGNDFEYLVLPVRIS